jgi:hypothetical protein
MELHFHRARTQWNRAFTALCRCPPAQRRPHERLRIASTKDPARAVGPGEQMRTAMRRYAGAPARRHRDDEPASH